MQQKEVFVREDILKDLCDNIKWNNICIIGDPEGEKIEGARKLFEKIMSENIPNLKKGTKIQIKEAQRVP